MAKRSGFRVSGPDMEEEGEGGGCVMALGMPAVGLCFAELTRWNGVLHET